jgi:hypothetical protein
LEALKKGGGKEIEIPFTTSRDDIELAQIVTKTRGLLVELTETARER